MLTSSSWTCHRCLESKTWYKSRIILSPSPHTKSERQIKRESRQQPILWWELIRSYYMDFTKLINIMHDYTAILALQILGCVCSSNSLASLLWLAYDHESETVFLSHMPSADMSSSLASLLVSHLMESGQVFPFHCSCCWYSCFEPNQNIILFSQHILLVWG